MTTTFIQESNINYWDEFDGSIFLSKIFSHPVKIGKIALFSFTIKNYHLTISMDFDIPDFPDNLPENWKSAEYNMCRTGITCNDIKDLKILNLPIHEVFTVQINRKNDYFTFEATSDGASMKFSTKSISITGPTVYINGPDDYYFK